MTVEDAGLFANRDPALLGIDDVHVEAESHA